MKNLNVSCILISLLLFACDYKKIIGTKESEAGSGMEYYIYQCMLVPIPNTCDINFWKQNPTYKSYIDYTVELFNSTTQICAGHLIGSGNIYDANETWLNQTATQTIVPLKCMSINASNNKGYKTVYDFTYSWYEVRASDNRKADLVFTHAVQYNSQGNRIITDTFSNYQHGDSLLCCYTEQTRCFFGSPLYGQTVCGSLNVQ
jgi:hypothetical protein